MTLAWYLLRRADDCELLEDGVGEGCGDGRGDLEDDDEGTSIVRESEDRAGVVVVVAVVVAVVVMVVIGLAVVESVLFNERLGEGRCWETVGVPTVSL